MDIRPINSVMAGMEVTVSKTDITYNGWTGCGYIVINPLTGSGGYMISGGMNGAVLLVLTLIFSLLAIVTAVPTGGVGAVFFGMNAIATLEGAIAALYGKDKLNEFMNCVGGIIAVHIAGDSILHLAESLIKGLVKQLIHGALAGYHVYEFGHCIQGSFYE